MKNFLLLFLITCTFPLASIAATYGACPGGASTGYNPNKSTTYISCSVGAKNSVSAVSNGVLPCATIDTQYHDILTIKGVDPQIIPEVCPPGGLPGICAQRGFAAGAQGIAPYGGNGTLEVGAELINGVFETINDVVGDIGQVVYTNIIGNADYSLSLNILTALYFAVYGALIVFGLAAATPGEVMSRLIKVGIIYTLLTPGTGWGFFDQYVATPVLGSMNDIIYIFMSEPNSQIGGGLAGMTPHTAATLSGPGGPGVTQLSPLAITSIAQPMDLIFSQAFCIIVLGHIFLGAFGWFFSLVFIWCAVEVFLMMVGAIITYIKSIIGLLFLFSLGPILIPFSLFEQTRKIFYGWVTLIFGFFLEPVMLFAFLGFFLYILNDQVLYTMYPNIGTNQASDFCWVRWFNLGPFDIWWWRPIRFFSLNPAELNPTGNYPSGTWHGSTPSVFSDLLYLLFLIHVGKAIIKFIGHLSHDISGGQGPGIVRSSDVGRWFSNSLFGGRRPGELAADMGRWGLYRGKNTYDRLTGRRDSMAQQHYTSAGYSSGDESVRADGTVFSDAGDPAGPAQGGAQTGNPGRIDASVTAEQATERLNFIANKVPGVSPKQIIKLVQSAEGLGGNSLKAESKLRDIAAKAGVSVSDLKKLVHESGSL